MSRIGRTESEFATPAVEARAKQLADRVHEARLAHRWTQADLAERARVSPQTLMRIERGNVAVSLGAWLGVLERLGLLASLTTAPNTHLATLVHASTPKRVRKRKAPPDDLDF